MSEVKISFPNGTVRSLTKLVERAEKRANEINQPVSLFGAHTADCPALDLEAGTDCDTCAHNGSYEVGPCALGIAQNNDYSISLSLQNKTQYCESYKQGEGYECTCGVPATLRVIK